MNKAQDVELAGYVTNPSQIRALLVKLLQHSANVAQSSGERTSRTITRVHSSRRRRGCYRGGEGDNDGWDLGEGDTRSFEIELKNGSFCRVESNIKGCARSLAASRFNRRSDPTCGYQNICILLMGGGLTHQSKKCGVVAAERE